MKKYLSTLFLLITSIGLLNLLFPSPTYAAIPALSQIRSVTYWPWPYDWTNNQSTDYAQKFISELPKIQTQGFNCVWFFLTWQNFEPVALPSNTRSYNPVALKNLQTILTALQNRGMCAILPLDYLGVGWSPGGVDAQRWIFDTNSKSAFNDYVTYLSNQLKQFPNIIYLLFNEATWPSGDALKDPAINSQFITYMKTVNPDIKYWNSIGYSSTSWDLVTLNGYNGSPVFFEWNDYTARSYLSSIVPLLRTNANTANIIGYHWNFQGFTYVNRLYSWNGNGPFDFLSLGLYPDNNVCGTNKSCSNYLDTLIAFLKTIEPNKQVFVGELGMSSYLWSDSDISNILPLILQNIMSKNLGFNYWDWQDLPQGGDLTGSKLGLFDVNGNPKIQMTIVKPFLTSTVSGDLNGDGKVDIYDYNILVQNFGKPYTIFDYNSLVANYGR